MTSSAPFGPEVQKFYDTEEENQNNTVVYFNCSAHCNSSDRYCKGSNSNFYQKTGAFISLSQYCLMLQLSQDCSPPHPFQCIIHYHLIKRNCKQNRIYQVKIRNRDSEKIWKYNIKRILGK